MNLSLMSKMAWKVMKGVKYLWVESIVAKYLPSSPFLVDSNPRLGSAFWNGIQCTKTFLFNHICWIIRNCCNVHFWKDSWLQKIPFRDHETLSILIREFFLKCDERVKDVILLMDRLKWKSLTIDYPLES